ncbi:MAG: nitrate reductase [Pirellulales bacterium]|nr:nitrate reductase [Pirellulales bacterium]
MSASVVARTRRLLAEASSLLHQREGRLTRELLLEPGRFGLGMVPAAAAPTATTTAVCGYCSTGCGLNLHLRDGEAVGLTPATEYPVNLGMACPKGWEALAVLDSPDRATTPLLRSADGNLQPIDWPTALATFCSRMKAIQAEHGPQSVAFLSTGQIPTEEMVLLGALAKFGMGMIHGDGNTRQCMATAATAYKESFGFDAPPFTYADFEKSDLIVLIGANLCVGHPILWERVLQNRRGGKVVVVDPRATETAQAAWRHLAIRPKSDLALLYGIAHVLVREGWLDDNFIAAHTRGFEDFARHVEPFTPECAAAATGLDPQQICDTAKLIHEHPRVSFWWTMGVNQSYEGTRTAQAIINLALMTGNIGRPGTGANSITGQCNAMGSRIFSNTTNLFGGRKFESETDRREAATALGVPVERIPDEPSWPYDRIVEGIRRGEIRGLWVVATNPAHSWIHQGDMRELLGRLDFLVVQDMYRTTETAQMADLVLPAAGWGEKEGTFINSERRIGLLKKVRRAPGEALADFTIFKLLAAAWGCEELFAAWGTPEDVFQAMKRLSRGRPCDVSGIRDYRMLDAAGGVQWPCPLELENPEPERRLFDDGRFFHEDGRARFVFDAPQSMPEPPDDEYPLVLLTGRGSVSQWHTQTRTAQSAVLRKLYPQSLHVELHPTDADRLGIVAGDEVTIESRRGALQAVVQVTAVVQPGQAFLPMHDAATNRLTLAHFDPHSRQPSYKDCAVRIRKHACQRGQS